MSGNACVRHFPVALKKHSLWQAKSSALKENAKKKNL
jgi:hypothetical protein